jgi:hypothetical protein
MPHARERKMYPLEGFDFAKLAEIYKQLRWRWKDIGIPDERELRATTDYLARELRINNFHLCGSGGIDVFRSTNGLMLSFDKKIEALL